MQIGPGERGARLPKPAPVVKAYAPDRWDLAAIALRAAVTSLGFWGFIKVAEYLLGM